MAGNGPRLVLWFSLRHGKRLRMTAILMAIANAFAGCRSAPRTMHGRSEIASLTARIEDSVRGRYSESRLEGLAARDSFVWVVVDTSGAVVGTGVARLPARDSNRDEMPVVPITVTSHLKQAALQQINWHATVNTADAILFEPRLAGVGALPILWIQPGASRITSE